MKDNRYGFSKVTPLEVLGHLCKNAEAVGIIVVNKIIAEHNVAIDFKGEETLKVFFKDIEKVLNKTQRLRDLHHTC